MRIRSLVAFGAIMIVPVVALAQMGGMNMGGMNNMAVPMMPPGGATVNAGAQMHRRAGAKMHQAAWSEGRAGAAFRGWAIRLLVSLPAECRRGLAGRGVCSA